MRENGSPVYLDDSSDPVYSKSAQGTVQHSKVCIRVRWGWIAYPVALVFLTLAFFVALLIETSLKKSPPRIWKSSPLALLYHGLATKDAPESRIVEREDTLNELRDMEVVAKSTSVRLECSQNGFVQLVEQRKLASE